MREQGVVTTESENRLFHRFIEVCILNIRKKPRENKFVWSQFIRYIYTYVFLLRHIYT